VNLIKCISRLRECGIFRDFVWPSDLPGFGRFNVIYGWNATGKTTLSRILRHLEKRTVPEGDVTLHMGAGSLSGTEFKSATVPIRVFNRDFVNDNVFRRDGGGLPPIFVLGEKSAEKQKEIDRLKAESNEVQSHLESARSKKQRAEKDLDRLCIDRARLIKETLRSNDRDNPYNNYDKARFRRDAEAMAKAGDRSAHLLNEAEREKLLAQHKATPKHRLSEVKDAVPDFREIVNDVLQFLADPVVSATIESLKDDPDLAEWTRQGLKLHRDRKAERCLFCEQALPFDRLAALEAHFSAEYERFMQRLDGLIGDLRALSKRADELRLPNKAELYQDLAAEYQTAEEKLRRTLTAVQGFLNSAVQALTEKKRRPFESIMLPLEVVSSLRRWAFPRPAFASTMPPLEVQGAVTEAVERLNEVIRKHNQACEEFQTRVTKARRRLAEGMIAEVLEDFVSRRDTLRKVETEVQAAQSEVDRLKKQIAKLERDILEHRRPAEELNDDLRKYLGHDELRLEIRDTGYIITRGGVPAHSLSEGEMTAVALLYFLKSLQDRDFDLKNGIVVLDDPVSSLDANALYLAFGFIRERTKEAGQLIILTHNFTFFRQVRNWFHHLKGQRKKDPNLRPARLYMLNCWRDPNGRCAAIRQLDPLLEEYNSDYHYLFARVYRASTEAGLAGLEENYVLPNMARRLLEAFLAFRQPQASGELWQKVQAVSFDEEKKLRILRFVHTYSHSDAFGEPEHDPSLLAEAGAVLKDLLEFIEAQDTAHFNAMVGLVNKQGGKENGQ